MPIASGRSRVGKSLGHEIKSLDPVFFFFHGRMRPQYTRLLLVECTMGKKNIPAQGGRVIGRAVIGCRTKGKPIVLYDFVVRDAEIDVWKKL